MSVPLTLLGLLERGPSHGYDLKRDYDAYFGRGKPLRYSQVYATLSRLARDGKAVAGPVLTRGCALSTGLCVVLHLLLESTVMPSAGGIAAAAAVGIVPLAFGNLLWDEGFRRGDSQLLAVMAYATPLCSALLLSVLGLESLTWTLGLGALVIVAAGLLSRSDRP